MFTHHIPASFAANARGRGATTTPAGAQQDSGHQVSHEEARTDVEPGDRVGDIGEAERGPEGHGAEAGEGEARVVGGPAAAQQNVCSAGGLSGTHTAHQTQWQRLLW